jgi:predicted nucleic acid-binding protein
VEPFWDYFLLNFTIIPVTEKILKIAKMVIKEYGLLPNDAIILATCKDYGVKYLISIDREDFTIPCEKEGIVLIDSVEKLKEILNK